MASSLRPATRLVRPVLSVNEAQARRRVIQLYRSWYRQVPHIVIDFDIPKNAQQCRDKLREEFMKNAHVKDIRVIDMLVIKGQMELKEVVEKWKNAPAVMFLFKDTVEPKPKDFLSKFLAGQD